MSQIYQNLPPTNGKVLLVTSVGEIDIELWTKEAPMACRNFIQLCMEGYYDNTMFHRIIPKFMVSFFLPPPSLPLASSSLSIACRSRAETPQAQARGERACGASLSRMRFILGCGLFPFADSDTVHGCYADF
eukprot:3940275-Rhodomonas_salina.4